MSKLTTNKFSTEQPAANGCEISKAEELELDLSIARNIEYILRHRKIHLVIKRFFDIVLSIIALIVLLPALLITALLIKFDSQGPVLFKQTRVGRNGREFKIFKFRTMIMDAEKLGMQITVGKDRRITDIGRFLRKYKIDELLQLINVLKGDMSFIGPRPEVPKYVSLYTEDQKSILKVRPGISDYASIEYKDENDILALSENPEETYIEDIMPRKINLNMKYIKKISLLEDIKIIIKTIAAVLR